MPAIETLYALPIKDIADSRNVNLYLLWKHLQPEPTPFKKSFMLPLYSLNALGASWLAPLSKPSLGVPFQSKQLPLRFNRRLFKNFPWIAFPSKGIITSKTLNDFADSYIYSYKRYKRAISFSTEQITFQAFAEYAIYCQKMFAKSLKNEYSDKIALASPIECVQYTVTEYMAEFINLLSEKPIKAKPTDSQFTKQLKSKLINFGMSMTFAYLRSTRYDFDNAEEKDIKCWYHRRHLPTSLDNKPVPEIIAGKLVARTDEDRFDSVDRSVTSHSEYEKRTEKIRRLAKERPIHFNLSVKRMGNKYIWQDKTKRREQYRLIDQNLPQQEREQSLLRLIPEEIDDSSIIWFTEFLDFIVTDDNAKRMILRRIKNNRGQSDLKEEIMQVLIDYYYEASGAYIISWNKNHHLVINSVKGHLQAKFPQSKSYLNDIFSFKNDVSSLSYDLSELYMDRFQFEGNEFLIFYPWEVKKLKVQVRKTLTEHYFLHINIDDQVFVDEHSFNTLPLSRYLEEGYKSIDENTQVFN
jgi:hypothetical protein